MMTILIIDRKGSLSVSFERKFKKIYVKWVNIKLFASSYQSS